MKKLLVILDMQNDFVTGPLGSEAAKAIVPRMVRKIKRRRRQGYDIAYVFAISDGGSDRPASVFQKSFQLVPEIAATVQPSDHKIIHDAEHATQLNVFLSTKNYKSVELVGALTDARTFMTARSLKYVLPHIKVRIDAACCVGDTSDKTFWHMRKDGEIRITHLRKRKFYSSIKNYELYMLKE